ncbi:hypothetical protein ADK57_35070 [Streptomyces sp. MMG1533]|nr:hypothetical protein [Streptomyces sp. MMG1533]KOU58925.1 hypothetical protein ADK57_35070 [Streptomyces sp. MMG1533]
MPEGRLARPGAGFVLLETDGEGAQRPVQGLARVRVVVPQPLLVGGDGGAQAGVGDHLGQQSLGRPAETAGGELRDDGPPFGVPERGVVAPRILGLADSGSWISRLPDIRGRAR